MIIKIKMKIAAKIKRIFYTVFSENDLLKNKGKLELHYYKVFKRKPNFNNIATFTEFIQSMKLVKSNEALSVFTDKYAVREHVKDLIGEKYLVKLLGVWDKEDEIDYSQLPTQFVLKTNHGSSWNIIVPNSQQLDIEKTNKQLKSWLSQNFFDFSKEPHYRRIKPKILAEEYLVDSNGELLDYKFFCFYGQPYFIQVDVDRHSANRSRILFNLNWERLPFTISHFPITEKMPVQPANFAEMLQIVKVLAQDHVHVRVDLYNVDGQIVFGELTFTHGSGWEKFYPNDSYDFLLGDIIRKRKTYAEFSEAVK